MELKVWVDGIQRVVCGANYNTTCQDVVLALASAMGRTGRFTLVEKWRDTERPLFPNEFPLQSLYKWGEYAGEIRFCLVQAEIEPVKRQESNHPQKKTHELNSYVNKSNTPQSTQYNLKPSEVKSLKRSSTFSCAQRITYTSLPIPSPLSEKSTELPPYPYNRHTSSTASTGHNRKGFTPHANGSTTASSSSSDSYTGSSSSSRRYLPQGNASSRLLSENYPVPSIRKDSRELHPANMPEKSLSYPVHTKDSSPPTFNQYLQHHQIAKVPSRHVESSNQHPHLLHSSSPLAISSKPEHSTSSKYEVSFVAPIYSQSSNTWHQQNSISSHLSDVKRLQLQQAHEKGNKSEQHQFGIDQSHQRLLQNNRSQQNMSETDQPQSKFYPTNKTHQQLAQSNQSKIHTQKDQFQHSYLQSGQSKKTYLLEDQTQLFYPANQQQYLISTLDYQNTLSNSKQSRENPSYTTLNANQFSNTSDKLHENSKSYFNESKTRPLQKSLKDDSNVDHLDDNVFDDDADETRKEGFHIQSEHPSKNIWNEYNANKQDRQKSKAVLENDLEKSKILENDFENRPATLDRRNNRPKVNVELPSRSLSAGDQGDKQKSNTQSEFRRNQQAQIGSNPTNINATRLQKTNTEISQPKTSSFTSAVAFLRNHGDSKSYQSDASTKQNTSNDSQEQQHISNNLIQTNKPPPQTTHSVQKFTSVSNGTNNHQPLNLSPNPPLNFNPPLNLNPSLNLNPKQLSQHRSAFTEVSSKPNLKESSSNLSASSTGSSSSVSPSHKEVLPTVQSSHKETSSTLSSYPQDQSSAVSSLPHRINHPHADNSIVDYQRQNCQFGLEIEEYDLDHNFPDVFHGQANNDRGVEDYRHNLFLKYKSGQGSCSSQRVEDRLQLLRTVHIQQDKLKTQEALIKDASLEIAALEQEEAINLNKLEALAADVSLLEKQEAEIKVEIENLEKSDWLTVLNDEWNRETILKTQVTNIREKQEQVESQIKGLTDETDNKSKEFRLAEQRINEENKKNEELERKALQQISQITEQLTSLGQTIDEGNKKLIYIEASIQETDVLLKDKEDKIKEIEEEIKNEVDALKSTTLLNEPGNNGNLSPSNVNALTTSENGEVILKILEGRLSPISSFPTGDVGDNLGGVTTGQHNYKSAMAVTNPNGVWV